MTNVHILLSYNNLLIYNFIKIIENKK